MIFLSTNKLFELKLMGSAELLSGFYLPLDDIYNFLLGDGGIIRYAFAAILLTNEMNP